MQPGHRGLARQAGRVRHGLQGRERRQGARAPTRPRAYDAANILIEGIKAGNTTRAKLLDYVEGLTSYEGISKTISFEDNGNVKGTDVFFFEVKEGKIELLGSTAELL